MGLMIDKDEVIDIILKSKDKLDAIALIQAKFNKEGHWIKKKYYDYLGEAEIYYECSVCGHDYTRAYEYCKHCNSKNTVKE